MHKNGDIAHLINLQVQEGHDMMTDYSDEGLCDATVCLHLFTQSADSQKYSKQARRLCLENI